MAKTKELKNEIKVMDIAALVAKARALKIEINDLVMDKNIGKLKNFKSISKKRKEMARTLTAMTVKKMIAALEPKEVKQSLPAGKAAVKEEKKVAKTKEGGKK